MLCAKCGLEIASENRPPKDEEAGAQGCLICGDQLTDDPEADTHRGFLDRLRRFGLGAGIRPLFEDRRGRSRHSS